MNLREVSLSIYSFGYSAGFIHDRRPEAAMPVVTIDNILDLAQQHGLGGIEFPVDRYFKTEELEKAHNFIRRILDKGMHVAVDLEDFQPAYIRALLPILSRSGLKFVRIKMSGFYGGNRYREPAFSQWLSNFVEGLRSLQPDLHDSGIKLLIENHQDLGADDLARIIGATSSDCVGINWDIGNSLAVLDTPETFLRKAGDFIGNVHLKDYRLFRCEGGFYLSRCSLGRGVVDFAMLLPELRRRQGTIPMAIELGAQQARQADVFTNAYWEAYPPYAVTEKLEFFSFLDSHLLNGDGWKGVWELNLPGQAIVESEMKELQDSIAFLKALRI